MQQTINQRIKIIRESLKMNQGDFAKSIKITQPSISRIETGENSPDERTLEMICSKHNVNRDWLMSGKGEMQDKGVTRSTLNGKENGVPYYDIPATAGQLSLPNQDHREVPEGYIDMPAFRGCDFALPVRGNSMANYINHGDVIICKIYDHTSYINFGNVFVIITKQECMVKYVKKGKDERHVELVSENKEHDPFQIKLADILHLYIVKGVIKQTTF